MQKQNRTVYFLCQSALIAAAYAVLTLAAAALGWAYGPIQFRFSEALTVLPALTPAAVPGLASKSRQSFRPGCLDLRDTCYPFGSIMEPFSAPY